MNELEKLKRLVKKIKRNKELNFVPRETLVININNVEYYISLICDNDFNVKVVLLDENNNVIKKLLELDGDRASIAKIKDKLYVFSNNDAYIYDVNNLENKPLKKFLGDVQIQSVCANENNIFAYSLSKDKIIKYDQNLIILEEYSNLYSKEDKRLSLSLTCDEETFFAIPLSTAKEEQYILLKELMEYYVGKELAEQNDLIHSCSYNYDENALYISMYNVIWIIKNGVEFSYLHFKNKGITSINYDNDIKKLIVNFGGLKKEQVNGLIIKLSDDEINEKAIPLTNISSKFEFVKRTNEQTKKINR